MFSGASGCRLEHFKRSSPKTLWNHALHILHGSNSINRFQPIIVVFKSSSCSTEICPISSWPCSSRISCSSLGRWWRFGSTFRHPASYGRFWPLLHFSIASSRRNTMIGVSFTRSRLWRLGISLHSSWSQARASNWSSFNTLVGSELVSAPNRRKPSPFR